MKPRNFLDLYTIERAFFRVTVNTDNEKASKVADFEFDVFPLLKRDAKRKDCNPPDGPKRFCGRVPVLTQGRGPHLKVTSFTWVSGRHSKHASHGQS